MSPAERTGKCGPYTLTSLSHTLLICKREMIILQGPVVKMEEDRAGKMRGTGPVTQ